MKPIDPNPNDGGALIITTNGTMALTEKEMQRLFKVLSNTEMEDYVRRRYPDDHELYCHVVLNLQPEKETR